MSSEPVLYEYLPAPGETKKDALAVPTFVPDPWRDKLELIKRTVAKGSTDDELQLFLYTARRTGLDPLLKQIHAVKRWNNKANREEMTIQTGIDGYRLIAERTGKYAGSDDPIFDSEESPQKATVTVYKMVDGVRCPFSASARWSQYFPGEKQGFMWKKMPHVMLGKCAESLALRKAFPADLGGLYTFEEMAQADQATTAADTPAIDISEDIEWIANSKDVDELKKFYFAAYKRAMAAKDKGAMQQLMSAKNKRLEEIQ